MQSDENTDIGAVRALLAKPVASITVDEVWHFFRLAIFEARTANYSAVQAGRLMDNVSGMGRVRSKERYFKDHYCRQVADAVKDIFRQSSRARILDVCCGTGTQALLFALLGAEVIGVDYHEEQLSTFRARVVFYEKLFGRPLNIQLHQADVFSYDFTQLGTFDAAYSHNGVGKLLSATQLLDRVGPVIRDGGVIVLKNSNPNCIWLNAAGRRPTDSSYTEYVRACTNRHWRLIKALGTSGLPRPLWVFEPVAQAISRVLEKIRPLQINISYTMIKEAAAP